MSKVLIATLAGTVGAAAVIGVAYTAMRDHPAAATISGQASRTGIAAEQVKKGPKPSKSPVAEPGRKGLLLTPNPLTLSGLAPGIAIERTLTVQNTNNQDVVLQFVTATVLSPTPGPVDGLRCTSPADVEVLLADVTPVSIAKEGAQAVPVTIRMNNSATRNQDDCKGKSFTFAFSATATSK